MFGTQNYYTPWYQQPVQQAQPQQQSSTGINWVQGKAGANSYIVSPGQTAQLMDSEDQVFYIKTVDASGMPLPLRTFRYEEVKDPQQKHQAEYITREEFEKRIAEISNANQSVPAA